MRIVVIRHGQSEANVNPGLYSTVPQQDIKLTQLGEEQCIKIKEKLSKIVIPGDSYASYVSPLFRTQLTEAIICGGFNPVPKRRIDPLLIEQNWGEANGCTSFKQFIDLNPDEQIHYLINGPFNYKPPRGESFADVYLRIRTFLAGNKIFNNLYQTTVLIVTSCITALAIHTCITGDDLPTEYMTSPNTAWPNCHARIYSSGSRDKDGHLTRTCIKRMDPD